MLFTDLIHSLKQQNASFQVLQETKNPLRSASLDSRTIQPCDLFIATKGYAVNGEQFIEKAIEQGAVAIATSQEAANQYAPLHQSIAFIGTENIRALTSKIALCFHPKAPKNIVAITGTNGKTSTADFVRQLWETMGCKSASLGTLGVRSSHCTLEKHMTTPDALYLHQTLSHLADQGITHLAMEASSHGIEQHRLDALPLKAAGFTNLTPEHLDYHKNMEAYLAAKAGLFHRLLPETGTCVLNADIPEYEPLKKISGKRAILSYGQQHADIQIKSITPQPHGQEVILSLQGKEHRLSFPLIGAFQLYNALCALGLVIACDPIRSQDALKALETLKGVPGRLQHVGQNSKGGSIYLDYAHTPDGLENVLRALRNHTQNHLHIVFGGGGDRDESTRAARGSVAQKLADKIYITDDNPRFEDPQKIRNQILEGCPKAQEIPDRTQGIQTAIDSMEEGDILVVVGKGIEEGQEVRGTTLPFSDEQTILDYIR